MRSSLKHPKNTSDNPVQFNFKRYKEDHTGTYRRFPVTVCLTPASQENITQTFTASATVLTPPYKSLACKEKVYC